METEKVLDLIMEAYGESKKTDDKESRDRTLGVINNWMLTHQAAKYMESKSIESLIHYVTGKYDLAKDTKLTMEQYFELGDKIETLIPILVE